MVSKELLNQQLWRRIHVILTVAFLLSVPFVYQTLSTGGVLANMAMLVPWLAAGTYLSLWLLPKARPWNQIAYGKPATLDEHQVQLRHQARHPAYWSVSVLASVGLLTLALAPAPNSQELQRLAYYVIAATFALPILMVAWMLPSDEDDDG